MAPRICFHYFFFIVVSFLARSALTLPSCPTDLSPLSPLCFFDRRFSTNQQPHPYLSLFCPGLLRSELFSSNIFKFRCFCSLFSVLTTKIEELEAQQGNSVSQSLSPRALANGLCLLFPILGCNRSDEQPSSPARQIVFPSQTSNGFSPPFSPAIRLRRFLKH